MGLVARLRRRTNNLSPAILLIFFLNGFLEAFPLTAFGQWLKDDIAMGPVTQSTFYATVFVPWSLKPLYGYISERFPIFHRRRRPYVVLSSLVSALSYLLAAFLVKDTAGAFAVTLMRTAANACCELMLGLLLVDCAARDMRNAGAVQGAATAARALSSVMAFLIGLPMYPCHGRDTGLKPTTIIAINAVFPAVAALLALLALPDPKVKPRPLCGEQCEDQEEDEAELERDEKHAWQRRRETDHASEDDNDDDVAPLLHDAAALQPPAHPHGVQPAHSQAPLSSHGSRSPSSSRPQFPVNGLLLPAVLLLLTWAALHDIMPLRRWLIMLGCVLCIEVVVGGALLRNALLSRRREESWRISLRRLASVWPAVVLFVLNAMPTADTQVGLRAQGRDGAVNEGVCVCVCAERQPWLG
jgi:hypothetical protein